MHPQSVLTDRVRWPSATLSIAPLYRMCGRVSHPSVAFPCPIAKVCEKFVNFKRIFLYEPCTVNKPLSIVDVTMHNDLHSNRVFALAVLQGLTCTLIGFPRWQCCNTLAVLQGLTFALMGFSHQQFLQGLICTLMGSLHLQCHKG